MNLAATFKFNPRISPDKNRDMSILSNDGLEGSMSIFKSYDARNKSSIISRLAQDTQN